MGRRILLWILVVVVCGAVLVLAAYFVLPIVAPTTWVALVDRPASTGVTELRLLTLSEMLGQPHWSPDGKRIAFADFVSYKKPTPPDEAPSYESYTDIFINIIPAQGRKAQQVWQHSGSMDFEGSGFTWSRDSQSLIYAETKPVSTVGKPARHTAKASANTIENQLLVWARSPQSRISALLATYPIECRPTSTYPTNAYLALSPDGKQVALLAMGRKEKTWYRGLGILELSSAKFHPMPMIPDTLHREVYPSSLAWSGDRLYFTCHAIDVKTRTRSSPPCYDIWSIRIDGTDLRQETSGPYDEYPVPRPGTSDFAFVRSGNLYLHQANGQLKLLVSAVPNLEHDYGRCFGPVGWSPDGKEIAFVWIGTRTGVMSIWVGRVAP